MARGRMISKSLSTSKKYARLYGAPYGLYAQAMYPLIVSHADDFGRLEGDAFTIKNSVVPASNWSENEISLVLQLLNDVHLVAWYDVNGSRYLEVIDFERHQIGLHKRTSSRFPRIPGNSRKVRDVPSQLKGTELKGTKSSARGAPIDTVASNIGIVTKIAHEAFDLIGCNNAELPEAVKGLCAMRRIRYDSELVGKAIESALMQRRQRSGAA